MNIKNNINNGNKSNNVAIVTALLSALALVLSVVYQDSKASVYILANIELLTTGVLSIITILVTLIKK